MTVTLTRAFAAAMFLVSFTAPKCTGSHTEVPFHLWTQEMYDSNLLAAKEKLHRALNGPHICVTREDLRPSSFSGKRVGRHARRFEFELQCEKYVVEQLKEVSPPHSIDVELYDYHLAKTIVIFLASKNKEGEFQLQHLGIYGPVLSYMFDHLESDFELGDLLRQNTSLTSLRLYSPLSAVKHLGAFPYLTHLDLEGTTDKNFTPIKDILSAKNEDASFRLCHLGVHVVILSDLLKDDSFKSTLFQNTSLAGLRLYGLFAQEACDALTHFPHLTHLDLSPVTYDSKSNLLAYLMNAPFLVSFRAPSKFLAPLPVQDAAAPMGTLLSRDTLKQIDENYVLRSKKLPGIILSSMQDREIEAAA